MNRIKELDPIRVELERHVKCISLFTEDYAKGIDSLLQFAIAIMMDKPIFLLVPLGVKVPEKVKLLADGIEFYKWGDKDSFHTASLKLIQKAGEMGFAA